MELRQVKLLKLRWLRGTLIIEKVSADIIYIAPDRSCDHTIITTNAAIVANMLLVDTFLALVEPWMHSFQYTCLHVIFSRRKCKANSRD